MNAPSPTQVDAIPGELRARPQWVCARFEERDGKTTKIPVRGDGKTKASTTDPTTWTSFEHALETLKVGEADAIGFVFTPDNPYVGIDLDSVRDPDTGDLEPWAAGEVAALDSYTEISASGRGLHIIVRGQLPAGSRHRHGPVEVYESARYFVMTGRHLAGTPTSVEHRQEQIEQFLARQLPQPRPPARPAPAVPVHLDDQELLDRAFRAKNGAKVETLWRGDWPSLGYGSQSEADLALVAALAFWTGPDQHLLDSLFRRSGLYREKWDTQRGDSTYGAETIATALAGLTDTYCANGNGNGASWAAADLDPATAAARPATSEEPSIARGRHRTDLGNSERLVDRHGDRIRYVPGLGWHLWDGRRWARDADGAIVRLMAETVRAIYVEAASATDEEERKALAAHAVRSESEARIKAAISLAETDARIVVHAEELDADEWVLNAGNGVVDLTTGDLLPHDPSRLITKLAGCDYVPDATHPVWERVLNHATGGDRELEAFLARAAGYTATGSTREEKLFYLHGPTASAKSTLVDAVKRGLGEYAVNADFDTFLKRNGDAGIRSDIARLAGARQVTAVEVDEGKRLAEGLIKTLTGGDTVTARRMYSDFFEYRPRFKLWFAANARVKVDAGDGAMWRRVLQIPLTHSLAEHERDPSVKEKINHDPRVREAVLAWIVRGCLDYQRIGLAVPDTVRDYTDEYRAENDVLADWLEDCCVLEPAASATANDLRASYLAWAETNGITKPISDTNWGSELRKHKCVSDRDRVNGKRIRTWRGVGLRDSGTTGDRSFGKGA